MEICQLKRGISVSHESNRRRYIKFGPICASRFKRKRQGYSDNFYTDVKVPGACTLSHKPFPYPDIWEPPARVFDTFGFNCLMWATDWTRCANFLSYREGVNSFLFSYRLSDSERDSLMGGRYKPSITGRREQRPDQSPA